MKPDLPPRHFSRRRVLGICAGTGAGMLLSRHPLVAQLLREPTSPLELVTRPIPSSGEKLPVIGIGTARRYDVPATEADLAPLRDVLREFPRLGGTVIDTAPSYGRAEVVMGALMAELKNRHQYFVATKVGAGAQGRAAAVAEMENSFSVLKTDKIDLMQAWNLRGVNDVLPLLREWKSAGRIRYYGVTTSSDAQYVEVETLLKNEKMDFVQVDYAIDNRGVEDRILPLARDKGIAVLINGPFGRGRVLTGFTNKTMPDWARSLGITTWAQFALKWIVGHPAVTVAIPGTAQMKYLTDNMAAALSPLPDETTRKKMLEFFDAN